MRRKKRKSNLLLISLFVVDRLTKAIALEKSFAIVNKGVSFGFIISREVFNLYFCLFLILSAVFLLLYSKNLNRFFLGLIIVGGISNLIDRVFYGGVVDFIKIPFLGFQNNLADFAIMAGIILLAVDLVKAPRL